ncbi:MAG: O-antigen ligase family protein [Saprospiraceae bacterium]|nr:O-antigen ligase family protein [Saprospiraceae bacterium]MBK9223241.1 O-antigen ligase family protein [Saprospiraceae bacterium]
MSHLNQSNHTVPAYFIGIYCFLCGFPNLLHLPFFIDRVQLSELWFLGMLLYFTINFKQYRSVLYSLFANKPIKNITIIACLYIFINSIAVLNSFTLNGVLEIIGKLYLLVVLIIILCFCALCNSNELIKTIRISIYGVGITMTVLGLIGWIASIYGFHNDTTEIYLNYPYFGDTHRLRVFTTTPSMYISIINICIVFNLTDYLFFSNNRNYLWLSMFFTLVAVLSFTKSFLFIAIAWIILYLYKYYKSKTLIGFLFLATTMLHFFLTHFLFLKNEKLNDQNFMESPFSSNEILYTFPSNTIVGSGYFQFKKTASYLFFHHPFLGIGPGNYNQEVALLKKQGLYPQHLPAYDPHSTYFGMLAETGFLGLLILISFGFSIWQIIKQSMPYKDPRSFMFFLLFWIVLAESISMDVMNFRHYWILFAAIIFYDYSRRKPLHL